MLRHAARLRILVLVLATATTLFAWLAPAGARAQELAVRPRAHPVHLILGVGAEGGGFVDQATGVVFGAQVHAGVHLYGLEIFGLSQGFVGSITEGPHRGTAEGLLWNSAMIGFGAGIFHLAVGPSLDFAWGCTSNLVGTDCYHGVPLFGLDARMAFQVEHLEVSANVHPTFWGSSTVTGITIGLGWAF